VPIYEYRCKKCGHRFERIQNFADSPKSCPECGGKVERLISSSAVQFKGAGFYATDYARKGSGGEAKPDKGEAKPADPKPAEKKESKPAPKSEKS